MNRLSRIPVLVALVAALALAAPPAMAGADPVPQSEPIGTGTGTGTMPRRSTPSAVPACRALWELGWPWRHVGYKDPKPNKELSYRDVRRGPDRRSRGLTLRGWPSSLALP
ncbi:hypothetical protein Pflav_031620 [Phytohabitans flavus]|uniref:Uncharacterized protein n=1 Tax=Phytohabitans flavus TaxID=1076124 RepID=A0A6F8XSC6_9ACTN|nr:hypothetical protein Pflav_031620 [Phytohabitans flavus]